MKYPVFLSFLIIAIFGYGAYTSEVKVRYYVSTTGDDINKGTVDQPFATLQAAQNAIRNDKSKGLGADGFIVADGIGFIKIE